MKVLAYWPSCFTARGHSHWYPLHRRLGDLRASLDTMKNRNLLLPGIELQFFCHPLWSLYCLNFPVQIKQYCRMTVWISVVYPYMNIFLWCDLTACGQTGNEYICSNQNMVVHSLCHAFWKKHSSVAGLTPLEVRQHASYK